MAKLTRQVYNSAKGEIHILAYNLYIPKKIVHDAGFDESKNCIVYSDRKGRIVVEQK